MGGELLKGKLILEDGTSFSGELFGEAKTVGEVVFNTGMTGYQEILTDPSYCRQIVTLTYPLIGNYGINEVFMQSRKSFVRGLIAGELCEVGSNRLAASTIREFLQSENIPCLHEVDTRRVTRHIRSEGTMKGVIVPENTPDETVKELLHVDGSGRRSGGHDAGAVYHRGRRISCRGARSGHKKKYPEGV